MQLNSAFLKAKMPYFTALFISGMYLNYTFRGFLIIDIFTCAAIALLAVLKPDMFCFAAKAHEYDEYDIIDAFPGYLLGGGGMYLAFMIVNYLGIISLDFTKSLSMIVFMFFFLIVVDRSRYN